MVMIHAMTMLPATPQRTAEERCAAPTPTMAPVMVCVVETGMPRNVARTTEIAAAGLGRKTAHRLQLGDALAHGLHDAPAAEQGAETDREETAHHHPIGKVVFGGGPTGDQQQPDDAHGLLRVVAPMAQRKGGR